MTPPTAQRLTGVDLLRAASICMVIAGHYDTSKSAVLPAALWFIDDGLKTFMFRGGKGVDLFFVISGFLITRMIMQREADIHRMSLRDFYARRVARIQPMLLASVLFGAIMLIVVDVGTGSVFRAREHGPFDLVFWTSLVTFTFNWARMFHSGGLDPSWGMHWDVMWSLAVEEQFYLFLPLALRLSGNTPRFVAIVVPLIGLCVISRWVMAKTGVPMWHFASNACFDSLAIGVLCALIRPRLDPRYSPALVIGGVLLLIPGFLTRDDLTGPVVFAIGAGCFILGSEHYEPRFGRLWRLPAAIGELSYEMYLLHATVVYLVYPHVMYLPLSLGLLIYVGLTALLAKAVHMGFTEPANQWLRRRLLPRRAPPLRSPAGAPGDC